MPTGHLPVLVVQTGSAIVVRYDIFSIDLDLICYTLGLAVLLLVGLVAAIVAVLVYRNRRRK
jgi:hypothetical protein